MSGIPTICGGLNEVFVEMFFSHESETHQLTELYAKDGKHIKETE
jgi:hypothetical protein